MGAAGVYQLEYFRVFVDPFESRASDSTEALVNYYLGHDGKFDNGVFSDDVYFELNPDVKAAGVPALEHFVTNGLRENRPFSPLIETAKLIAACGGLEEENDLCAMLRELRFDTELFSIMNGWLEIRYFEHNSSKFSSFLEFFHSVNTGEELVNFSLFIPEYYTDDRLPVRHRCGFVDYLVWGWREGRDPHPLFDGAHYLRSAGLTQIEEPPLIHYVKNFRGFVGDPSPFFDAKYYNHLTSLLQKHSDLAPLDDFCKRPDFVSPHPHLRAEIVDHFASYFPTFVTNSVVKGGSAVFIAMISLLRKGPSLDGILNGPSVVSKVDVLILDYNKPILTLLSALAAALSSLNVPSRIYIGQNGTNKYLSYIVSTYTRMWPNISVHYFNSNKYFGEGNNLLSEIGDSEYVLFLNNDAFLSENSISEMAVRAADQSVGMVGSLLYLPSNTVQEIGGLISGCVAVIQVAKHMDIRSATTTRMMANPYSNVGYVSAACALMRRDVLNRVGGFDYSYEPFYYEDTDLCARVASAGFEISVSNQSLVLHLENTSTLEFLGSGFSSQIQRSRDTFRERWFNNYENRSVSPDKTSRHGLGNSRDLASRSPAKSFVSAVYTPFGIQPGGGERYIFSVVMALSRLGSAALVVPNRTSVTRFLMVASDLGINVSDISVITFDDLLRCPRPDIFVSMGNEMNPPIAALGARCNIYHCQFPFPLYNTSEMELERVAGYDLVIVNSEFTKNHFIEQQKTYKVQYPNVEVVSPPVDVPLSPPSSKNLNAISALNVGRITNRGHAKRQDAFLDIMDLVHSQYIDSTAVIVGGLSVDAQDQDFAKMLQLRAAPKGFEVQTNLPRDALRRRFAQANLYIHCTGLGIPAGFYPELHEHFGITVVEAMGSGCVPIVPEGGGSADLIKGVGFAYRTVYEAAAIVGRWAESPKADKVAMMERVYQRAVQFSDETFAVRVNFLVSTIMSPPTKATEKLQKRGARTPRVARPVA